MLPSPVIPLINWRECERGEGGKRGEGTVVRGWGRGSRRARAEETSETSDE